MSNNSTINIYNLLKQGEIEQVQYEKSSKAISTILNIMNDITPDQQLAIMSMVLGMIMLDDKIPKHLRREYAEKYFEILKKYAIENMEWFYNKLDQEGECEDE